MFLGGGREPLNIHAPHRLILPLLVSLQLNLVSLAIDMELIQVSWKHVINCVTVGENTSFRNNSMQCILCIIQNTCQNTIWIVRITFYMDIYQQIMIFGYYCSQHCTFSLIDPRGNVVLFSPEDISHWQRSQITNIFPLNVYIYIFFSQRLKYSQQSIFHWRLELPQLLSPAIMPTVNIYSRCQRIFF